MEMTVSRCCFWPNKHSCNLVLKTYLMEKSQCVNQPTRGVA